MGTEMAPGQGDGLSGAAKTDNLSSVPGGERELMTLKASRHGQMSQESGDKSSLGWTVLIPEHRA